MNSIEFNIASRSTIVKPYIENEILEAIQEQIEEDRQVIVHCCYPMVYSWGYLIRIWKSTFLEDVETHERSPLLHAENISVFPYWTEVPIFKEYWFTLIFSSLPKTCKKFHLIEEIPQSGGFYVPNISRNSSDVYRVRLS